MKAPSPITRIDLLGCTFILLKLSGSIDWSWWWIVSPWIAQFVIALLPSKDRP